MRNKDKHYNNTFPPPSPRLNFIPSLLHSRLIYPHPLRGSRRREMGGCGHSITDLSVSPSSSHFFSSPAWGLQGLKFLKEISTCFMGCSMDFSSGMVFSMGWRGISAVSPGAVPPPSSLTLVMPLLFQKLFVPSPLSSCGILPFLIHLLLEALSSWLMGSAVPCVRAPVWSYLKLAVTLEYLLQLGMIGKYGKKQQRT